MQRKQSKPKEFSRVDGRGNRQSWVIHPDALETPSEAYLWLAFVEQYGVLSGTDAVQVIAPKNKSYQVMVPDPAGGHPFFVSVKFSDDVDECLDTIDAEILMGEKLLQFIGQHYDVNKHTSLDKNKVYVLPSAAQLVRLSKDVVFIDPMNLTPETARVLRKNFYPDKKELTAGDVFSDQDKDYILVRDLGWYARKEGKPGNRYGVFGAFKGEGATAEVSRVEGTLKDDEGEELSFKSRDAVSKADKKRKPLVVKRQIHANGKTNLVENEHEALKRAQVKVKPLTIFTNDDGQIISLIFMEEAKDICLFDYLYDKDLNKREFEFYDAIALCEAAAWSYVKQVAAPGIVHSDLKPDNMFVKPARKKPLPKVTVIDYGFAQLKEKIQALVVGTPEFVAPEVFAHKSYDEKRDIFSLGILFAEILGSIDRDALIDALEKHQTRYGIKDDGVNFARYYSKVASRGDLKMRYLTLFENLRNFDSQFKAEIETFILSMISVDPAMRPDGSAVANFFSDLRQRIAAQPYKEPVITTGTPGKSATSRKGKSKVSHDIAGSSYENEEASSICTSSGSFTENEGGAYTSSEFFSESEPETDEDSISVSKTELITSPSPEKKQTQSREEFELIGQLLAHIEALDGRGDTICKNFRNDGAGIYMLPKGAAEMFTVINNFRRAKITIVDLIRDCMKCAELGCSRDELTMFSRQDAALTKFYYQVYSLLSPAAKKFGCDIKLDFNSLRN